MEKLPSEILCIILSFLDKKSRKSATATCQLWFDVIRNSNLSNDICYKSGVWKFQESIEKLEWDWKRWPALKTFEIQESSGSYRGKRSLLNALSIDFKQCPTLEIVIFNSCTDIAEFFPNCPYRVAKIEKLAFNPQCEITEFGVDHIWRLQIQHEQDDEVFKLINENVKGLKELKVQDLSQLDNLVCMNALLELDINLDSSSELKIAGLKKLKALKVRKLAQLDNLVGMDESLLELGVQDVSERELKEYDFSNIAQRFKNLQKCDIDVYYDCEDIIQAKKNIQDAFQNSATRVEIVFDRSGYFGCPIYLIKEPFQKNFMKKKVRELATRGTYANFQTFST